MTKQKLRIQLRSVKKLKEKMGKLPITEKIIDLRRSDKDSSNKRRLRELLQSHKKVEKKVKAPKRAVELSSSDQSESSNTNTTEIEERDQISKKFIVTDKLETPPSQSPENAPETREDDTEVEINEEEASLIYHKKIFD